MSVVTPRSRFRAARATPSAVDAAKSSGFGPRQAGFILALHLPDVVTLGRSLSGVFDLICKTGMTVSTPWRGKDAMSNCTESP